VASGLLNTADSTAEMADGVTPSLPTSQAIGLIPTAVHQPDEQSLALLNIYRLSLEGRAKIATAL
jgi:hypothetical protein